MKIIFRLLAVFGLCAALLVPASARASTAKPLRFTPLARNATVKTAATSAPKPNRWDFLLRTSNTAGVPQYNYTYGNPQLGDLPIVGDYNGDGVDTFAVARPDSTNHILWLERNELSSGAPDTQFVYGNANTDVPVAGDWDGNGTFTPGVARIDDNGNITWLLRNSNSGGAPDITFVWGGISSGIAITAAGDWDGVKENGYGVGTINLDVDDHWLWDLTNTHDGTGLDDNGFTYGGIRNSDAPVIGDWNGDGSWTPGVARIGTNGYWQWLLRNENTGGTPDAATPFYYGNSKYPDLPIAGDWSSAEGASSMTPGVVRPIHV
jgi:hypothetical protein